MGKFCLKTVFALRVGKTFVLNEMLECFMSGKCQLITSVECLRLIMLHTDRLVSNGFICSFSGVSIYINLRLRTNF